MLLADLEWTNYGYAHHEAKAAKFARFTALNGSQYDIWFYTGAFANFHNKYAFYPYGHCDRRVGCVGDKVRPFTALEAQLLLIQLTEPTHVTTGGNHHADCSNDGGADHATAREAVE